MRNPQQQQGIHPQPQYFGNPQPQQGMHPQPHYSAAVYTDCTVPSVSWSENRPTQPNNGGRFNGNRGNRNSCENRRRPSKPKRLNDKDEDFQKLKNWSDNATDKPLQAAKDMMNAQYAKKEVARNRNNLPVAGPSRNTAPAGFLAPTLPAPATAAAVPVTAPAGFLAPTLPAPANAAAVLVTAPVNPVVAAGSSVAMSVTPAAASDMTENIKPKQVMKNVIGQLQGPTLNSATPDNSLAAPVAPPQKVNQPKKWALFVPKPVKEDETKVQVKGHTITDREAYLLNRCKRAVGTLLPG